MQLPLTKWKTNSRNTRSMRVDTITTTTERTSMREETSTREETNMKVKAMEEETKAGMITAEVSLAQTKEEMITRKMSTAETKLVETSTAEMSTTGMSTREMMPAETTMEEMITAETNMAVVPETSLVMNGVVMVKDKITRNMVTKNMETRVTAIKTMETKDMATNTVTKSTVTDIDIADYSIHLYIKDSRNLACEIIALLPMSEGTTEIPKKSADSSAVSLNLESDKVVKDKENINFTEGSVDDFKFYPDNPKNHRHKYRWANKEASKYYDPCEESRQASISCVLRNQKDKSVCQDFFDAYRECSKDFFAKRRQDRREGRKGWGIW